MLKVLLSFVGKQDPFSDKTGEEGSIVTLCRQIKPDLVYLIPTASGLNVFSDTEENATMTKEWIQEYKDDINSQVKVFIKPVKLINPTDYSAILPKVRQETGEILKEIESFEYELHLNCSSGTPQLKSTWIILSNAGIFINCHLWQVGNPQYCDERVTELEITFMEEENILQRIKRYADEFLFQRIAEECGQLKDISCYSYRKEKADLLQRIFSAYQSWDLIRYDDAYQRLYSVYCQIKSARDLADLSSILERQVETLSKLRSNDSRENEDNLLDLYFNAQRRLLRGDYTDTLSRFWRVYEGTLYAHVRKHYHIEPTELDNSLNKDNMKKIKDYARRNPVMSDYIRKLSIHNAEVVLEQVFKDQRYGKLEKTTVDVKRGSSYQKSVLLKVMKYLREYRNESIVAHGMRPINGDDAYNSLLCMKAIFSIFFNDINVDNYSLSRKNMLKILSVLESTYSLG